MSDFQKFLIDKGIISNLIKRYGIDLKDNVVNDFIHNMVKNLTEIESKEIHDLDILAKSYEKIIPYSQRKTMGEFYTPIQIVDYILKRVGYTERQDIDNKKLIDLSCGSGSFLIRAVKVLLEKIRKHIKLKENSELTPKQAMEIINKIKSNISGMDINPIACILCQINFYYTLFELVKIILESDKDYQIPVFNILNKDTLQFNFNDKYDYVVGNPPYLFIRAIPYDYRKLIEKLPLETNKGQYDFYQLFMEIGIHILKLNGLLGYIIPDSLLALSNRRILRKYIYNSTKIREIYYSGPQFDEPVVSNIVITLEKESDEIKRKNNQIILKFSLDQSQADNVILQNLIEKWNYRFLINLNEQDREIIEFLTLNFLELNDLEIKPNFKIDIWRGVELGKNGKVIFCNTCNKYFPLPNNNYICKECKSELNNDSIESIIRKSSKDDQKKNYKPFLYSINRYQVKELKYINTTKQGINYKELNRYKNRVIVRQLAQNSLICATYDKGSLTSQSLYNLKILKSPIAEFNNYYLLGLLNSQLLAFYFIKSFGSYKKLFPRILIENLKSMPIVVPEIDIEKKKSREIIILVRTILKLDKFDTEEYINLQNKINSLVFDLYRITNEQRNYISDVLKNL